MPLFIAKPSKESLFRRISGWIRSGVAIAVVASLSLSLQARVLDNFNDNTKTGWTDFTFVPGFGLPTEAGGQFQFKQNVSPSGGAIFSASQKTSDPFELKEGRSIEYRVDVIKAEARIPLPSWRSFQLPIRQAHSAVMDWPNPPRTSSSARGSTSTLRPMTGQLLILNRTMSPLCST